jgi:hypothetical protein
MQIDGAACKTIELSGCGSLWAMSIGCFKELGQKE